jgi:predicted DNA-binding WGR domain protein
VDQDFSPVQHTISLRRVDPETNIARFYVLTLERDLFGNVVVTRQWGRVGTAGRQIIEPFMAVWAAPAPAALPSRANHRPVRSHHGWLARSRVGDRYCIERANTPLNVAPHQCAGRSRCWGVAPQFAGGVSVAFRPAKSAARLQPLRLQIRTVTPFFRTITRMPSCLSSWIHCRPIGTWPAGVTRQGRNGESLGREGNASTREGHLPPVL